MKTYSMVLLVITGLLLSILLAFYGSYNAEKNQADRNKESIISRIDELINQKYLAHTIELAALPEIYDFFINKERADEELSSLEIMKRVDGAIFTALVSTEGKIITASSYEKREEIIGLDINDRLYVKEALQGRTSVYLTLGKVSAKRAAVFAAPVFGKKEKRIMGIVMINLPMENLDKILMIEKNTAILINGENEVFASNNPDLLGTMILDFDNEKTMGNWSEIRVKKNRGTYFMQELLVDPIEILPDWHLLRVIHYEIPYLTAFLYSILYLGLITLFLVISKLRRKEKERLAAEYNAAAAGNYASILEESESRLRLAQENGGIGIWEFDLVDYKIMWGDTHYTICQMEKNDFEGTVESYMQYVHSQDQAGLTNAINSAIKEGKELFMEYRFLPPRSEKEIWLVTKGRRICDKDGNPLKLTGITTSIDEQKHAEMERENLEKKLQQTQKMDALGQLAGGVAHDFNNMLGGIQGAAELLKEHLDRSEESEEYLSIIMNASDKAAKLTQQLLSVSHRKKINSTIINIHSLISETTALLKRTIDKSIDIKIILDAPSSSVVGDSSLLENLLLNMGINASHAMTNGGSLTFKTRHIDLDNIFCENSTFELNPGKYIELEIKDTGCGIPPENLSRIFEPFFSTKQDGKGTGLGLATAYGTVRQHGGAISVYSEISKGTVFHILLPLSGKNNSAPPPVMGEISKREGTILIVDDESVMRTTARAILENVGYSTLTAENGREGLEVYNQNWQTIDIVLLDMIMPIMNGKECFLQMKKINPRVKVLLTSGFSREEDILEMQEKGLSGFINKPYAKAHLLQTISNILS
jgi:C4-dicarboxylate-specific signal transduction histidine kinase/CheY-like chemotaxis protein